MGANDNRLMFQVAIGDIRKQLDARKREIDKWIKENPATINVGVKFELEDLKSKLQTLGVVFGSTNKEIKALSTEMEKTLDKVNSKLNEAGNSGSNGVGKMTSGARQLAEAMKEVNVSREKAVAASNEEANARQNVANIEQNILEARKRIAAIQSGKMTNFKWLEDAKMLKESTNSQKSLKDVYIEKLNGQIAVWLGQQERGEKAITEAVERRVKAENELAAAQSKADSLKQLMERTTTQQRYNNMLADTEKLLERIKAASAGANSSSLLNVGVRDVGAFLEKASSRSAFKDEQNVVANLVSEYNRLLKVYGPICSEEERKAKATDAAARKTEQNIAKENAARQKSVAAVRTEADELVRSRKAALQGQGFDLSKLLSLGKDKLGTEQYDAVRNALRSIREELRQIDTIMQRGGRSTGLMLNIGGNTRDYSHVIATAQQVVNIKNQAAQANNQLASSERNVASNVGMTTSALSGQSQVLSDLKTMAMQYVSVWAAKSFINNIIEQGGLLEQQRLSIGAILQDTYEADALFGKIKGLAIKSPFGVTELDAMTKQLSAYGFKYSELYEWTKRLADISAATGTEVSRLALALGHVRSEGALSGYTLRQFAMGNIPMLAKLSEKLGKTSSEIRKMVSRKEIGYDEVLEVFKELTDEGGMFYNAQETMAEALNAKFKNLRDSFQIMYSEMAEGAPGDALKRLAEILTDLSRNWKVLMPMISTGIGLWGMSRLATMAMNYELARTGTYLGVNAIATSKYNVAQLRQIATMGRWRVALMGARTALMSVGRFLASPWTIGFAAVEGLVYLWQRHNQEVSKAKELTSGFSNLASESQKNLTARLADIDPFKEGMSESELKSGIDSMTDTIKNYAANSQEVLNTAFGTNADGKVKSLAEQYQYLREQMEKTVDVYKELARTADAFEFGVNYTDGGWFDDNVESDLTDYANAMKEYDDAFTTFTANNQLAVSRSLDALMRMKPELKDILQSLASDSERIKWLYENQFTQKDAYNGLKHQLHLNRADYGGLLGYATGNYLKGQKNEAMSELDKFLTGVEERLKKFGYDFSDNGKHLTENQVGNLLKQSKEWLDKHPEWQNIYDVIQDKLNQRWGIPITPEVEETEKKLNEWQQQMQDWLDKHGSTLKIKPEMSRSDIIKMVHGSIEETQKTIDQTKPILLRFKADLSDLGNLPTGLQTPWGRKQAADYQAATPQNQTAKDFLNEFGLPQPKEKRTSRKGSTEDKEAKRLRELTKLYKDAFDWYNKYEKQVGESGALKKVQAQFQPLFDEFNKTWKTNLTLDSIPKYKANLESLLAEAMKLYQSPKHKNSYMVGAIKQLRDAISNVDYEEANRQMEIFASKVKIQLDSLTRAWSTFNSVRETTGNVDFAAQIARVSYDGNLIQNSADAIRNQIQSYYNEAGGNGVLTFDMELSDEDILKKFQNAVPSNDEGVENYQKRIKGLVEAYKQWRDLQRTVRDDAITAYAKMVTDSMSLKDKIAKINNEYQKTITNLNTLRDQGIIGQPEYAKRKQQAKNQRKVDNLSALANSATFEQSFGIVGNVLKNAARELDKKLREEISSEDFKNLTPSQQKSYIEASDKLHSASQTATSPFNLNAWGELMEASRTYKENVNKLVASLLRLQKATIALEKAEEDERNAKNESQRKDAQERRKKAEEEKRAAEQAVENDQTEVNQSGQKLKEKSDDAVEGLDNFSTILGQFTQGTLSSFVLAVGNLIKSIKGDGELAQSVGQLFGKAGEKIGGLVGAILSIIDALGDDPTGFIDNLLNKIASVIENVLTNLPQIIGSVIKGAGNIVASAVDGVGGLFGLDFGLSDLFNPDKKLQERIDDLKADVTKIEANTSVLRSLRERSLGYDSGQLRKELAKEYTQYEKTFKMFGREFTYNSKYGAAGKAMSEFYSQNLNGNGYSQEYANLLKQRQDYIDMYNAENDKKDSSASAMAEYQSKIAELDEEIMFFTQDLANTLWGIDIKSWANQISDALWNAFENGENAVKAFEKTAKDIVASVAKEMMKLGFIEPLMQNLQKQLFGTWDDSLEMYVGGAIKYTKDKNGNVGIDMQGSEKAVLKVLGSFYGQSEEFAKAGETFYNWVERATGIRFSDNDSALSGNIKGITEDTADLLASYINAIRADVAMNRAFIAMFIQEYWISYVEQITSVHTTLRNIDRNVAAMALTFSETGKIYGLIENISSRLDKFANGVDKISVQ